MNEVLPCPHCGGRRISYVRHEHRMQCDDCEAEGPRGYPSKVTGSVPLARDAAEEAWNRRDTSSTLIEAIEKRQVKLEFPQGCYQEPSAWGNVPNDPPEDRSIHLGSPIQSYSTSTLPDPQIAIDRVEVPAIETGRKDWRFKE